MSQKKKFQCSFPAFVKKVPGYAWYQGLDKTQKKILMHKTLALGGAGMTLSGCFAAAATGSFSEVWGTTLTGAFLVARNLTQIWWIKNMGDQKNVDLENFNARQNLRKNLAQTSTISALGYIPQLAEGVLLQDPVRLATAGSAFGAYTLSTARYVATYITRKEEYKKDPYTPGYLMSKFPGDMLIFRGVAQTGLAFKFINDYGLAAGGALIGASLIQTTGAIIKRSADSVYKNDTPQAHLK